LNNITSFFEVSYIVQRIDGCYNDINDIGRVCADMVYKRIVFAQPCVAQLQEYELPDPGPGQVQVRLTVSAISSGTERANLVGDKSLAWNREAKEATFPRYVGYSSAGVITKVGEGVAKFRKGDRVATWWGTHSEVLNISADNVCLIEDISYEDAAMFHIATFPLAAIRKCRLEIGESAIVMGMGMLGLIALQLLKAAGAVPVIAVDPNPQKREKALRCGADYALDPYKEDFAETVKRITGGGANVGIEVTGVGAGLNGILDCMARFGRVALLGCTRDSNFTVDYYRKVHGPGVTLIGAHTMARPKLDSRDGWWSQEDDIRTLKRLTELDRINLAALVDEVHSPDKAAEIYARLAVEKVFPLVLFDWRKMK